MIVKDYYYKGDTCGVIKTDSATNRDYADIKERRAHIRLVGTRKEIDQMNKRFLSDYKYLYVDELYDYEVPKKGSYWYNHHCFGTSEEYKEEMEIISSKLKEYKQRYKKEGSFSVWFL